MRKDKFLKLAITIAAIVGIFGYFVSPLAYSIRQGLDLQGGTHVVLEAVDTPQAEVVLLKPCAAIVDGALVMYPRDVEGTLVMSTGLPRWADWVAADGSIIATSNCTDAANGGGWQLEGGETPAGETSPLLYAGGLVQLGETALT